MVTRFSAQFKNRDLFRNFEETVKRLHPAVSLVRVNSESYGNKVNYQLTTEESLDVLLIGMTLAAFYSDDEKCKAAKRN